MYNTVRFHVTTLCFTDADVTYLLRDWIHLVTMSTRIGCLKWVSCARRDGETRGCFYTFALSEMVGVILLMLQELYNMVLFLPPDSMMD